MFRIQESNHGRSCSSLGAEYSHHSSIHGVKYLNRYRNTLASRICWVFILALSLCSCTYIMSINYIKWRESPGLIRVAEKLVHINNIPFPAVTICPESKAKSNLVNITEAYQTIKNTTPPYELPDEVLARLEALSHVCDPHLFSSNNLSNDAPKDSIVTILKEVAIPLEEVFLVCKWRNKMINCFEIFKELVTEEGVCYTFNSLDASQILKGRAGRASQASFNIEEGYLSKDSNLYPHRALSSGVKSGLAIVVHQKHEDVDYICRGPVQGVKVHIHSPGELPSSKNYVRIPVRKEVMVSVKVQVDSAAGSLGSMCPEQRNCYFPHENPLKYFKRYSAQNCELECLSNYVSKACGCVKFSMPRDKNVRVCGQRDVDCYDDAENLFYLEEMDLRLNPQWNKTDCKCLPACHSISYETEISQADFEFKKLLKMYQSPDMMDDTELSRLTVFFKDSWFSPTKLIRANDYVDFLATNGGLLALFLGASLLSLIEIIYFLIFKSRRNSVYFKWTFDSEELVNNAEPQKLFVKSGKIPQDKSTGLSNVPQTH